jgi:hypothetical protein
MAAHSSRALEFTSATPRQMRAATAVDATAEALPVTDVSQDAVLSPSMCQRVRALRGREAGHLAARAQHTCRLGDRPRRVDAFRDARVRWRQPHVFVCLRAASARASWIAKGLPVRDASPAPIALAYRQIGRLCCRGSVCDTSFSARTRLARVVIGARSAPRRPYPETRFHALSRTLF